MTYAELQAAAASLPARITDATYSGDEMALQRLEAERATIRAKLLFAELQELRAQLVEEREELAEAQTEERAARQTSIELVEDVKAAQQRLELHRRSSGLAQNRTASAKAEIRRIQARIEEIAAEQAAFATAAAAPVQRNLTRSHIPGPHRPLV